jgi:hypothetical protein
MSTRDIIDSLFEKDYVSANDAFKIEISSRIKDVLEDKKIEIAGDIYDESVDYDAYEFDLSEETLMELSKKTLASYISKATQSKADAEHDKEAAYRAKSALSSMKNKDTSFFSKQNKKGEGRARKDYLDAGRRAAQDHLNDLENRSRHVSDKRSKGVNRAISRLAK